MERDFKKRSSVLLATCQADLLSLNGDKMVVRILLDPGSELSFITEEIVNKLKLTRKNASIPLLGIGKVKSGRTRGVVKIDLSAVNDDATRCTLQAYILPRLTCHIPTFTVDANVMLSMQNLQLADPEFGRPGPIHLIIGSDFYNKIILPEIIPATAFSPLAQLTIFGWALSGPVTPVDFSSSSAIFHSSVDRDLENLLLRFWTQEEVYI